MTIDWGNAEFYRHALTGAYLAVITQMVVSRIGLKIRGKIIPDEEDVKRDFVAPKNLEIRCKGSNWCSQKETILKIDDKQYFLKYDENKVPKLYEVK
jgi:hypothetical protein